LSASYWQNVATKFDTLMLTYLYTATTLRNSPPLSSDQTREAQRTRTKRTRNSQRTNENEQKAANLVEEHDGCDGHGDQTIIEH
jgi:hypothetical protein